MLIHLQPLGFLAYYRGINGISYWLGPTATFGNTDTAIRNWMYTPWGILCIFINKEITMGHQLIFIQQKLNPGIGGVTDF